MHVEKARLLLQQSRYDLAEKELRAALAGEPNDAEAHALLAICLRQTGRVDEALKAAGTAIRAAPDYAFAHYVLAGVHDQADRLKEAEAAIREAIRLEPNDADYLSRLSNLLLQQRRWEEALQAAGQGLALDPQHAECLNYRTVALSKLGRLGEAGDAVRSALAANPDDAMTHASKGWHDIENGRYEDALASFREALRLDSSLQWAREGIVEALKARNPVYRVMLRYFLWTSQLQAKTFVWLFVGGYVLARMLREWGKAHPEFEAYTWLILGPYIAFCVLTWIADPLFNLLLRLDRVGRIALSRQQWQAANWFGGSVLLALAGIAAWLVHPIDPLLILALVCVLMVVPIAASFGSDSPRARRILIPYAAVIGLAGALFVGMSFFMDKGVIGIPAGIFLFGVATFTWVATAVRMRVS